jgi:opacity protein-like surface antigen
MMVSAPPAALGAKGDTRAGLFIGTTTLTVKSYRTFGTHFGGTFGWEFEKNLLLTVGGSFISADGEGVVTDSAGNSQLVNLSGTTAAATTGLLAYLKRDPDSIVNVFVGAGVSLLSYDFDFTGTEVGKTSGTAPGFFASIGMEINFTDNLTLILDLGIQAYRIKTEAGDSTGLASGGLVFSLRISG